MAEAGEKEGVVDEQERKMIESVIEFRNRSVAEIMTPRPAITAMEVNATMDVVKQMLEESGIRGCRCMRGRSITWREFFTRGIC